MKRQNKIIIGLLTSSMVFPAALLVGGAPNEPAQSPAKSAAIPLDQIGAVAGKQHYGDGLAVIPTAGGAYLRCVFQKLEGEATSDGLWLTSTVTNAMDRFRVKAVAVGRVGSVELLSVERGALGSQSQNVQAPPGSGLRQSSGSFRSSAACSKRSPSVGVGVQDAVALPNRGTVEVAGQLARFLRPGLTEEYSVRLDGVRQDFLLTERPAGEGELQARLEVTGARVEVLASGAQLVLEPSGRKISYSRLRVTDATGHELPARLEVGKGPFHAVADRKRNGEAEERIPPGADMAVWVNDADALYPVRIDPIFSDANWVSVGGIFGPDDWLSAAVVDSSGNLYIGGSFSVARNVLANNIAKWDGSSWSALGSGCNGPVVALAISGRDLYAGGWFTNAGGIAANYVAKWDGSIWSALGTGVSGGVRALAASRSSLYVGGEFTTAGGIVASNIAKWEGGSWAALGSGIKEIVFALAVSGTDLYAGAGAPSWSLEYGFGYVARWDGSDWSALGEGMSHSVLALGVSGGDVYAAGYFRRATNSGGVVVEANHVAKWDGSSWSALGSGTDYPLVALAVSGTNVYAAGWFRIAGGFTANHVAKWNGSTWSALGSGIDGDVSALAVSSTNLFAGGRFSRAGGIGANDIAKWDGSRWSALGQGMAGPVWALVASDSDVYAGGGDVYGDGSGYGYVAKWDGSSWSALGSGMNYPVYALAAFGGSVYAGGDFTNAGGAGVNYIAKWDGNSWSALGSGVDGGVFSLAVCGGDVYAGGLFTTADGIAATKVGKWDGSHWSPLGSGIEIGDYDGGVAALAVYGRNVYAGGWFRGAGGIAANCIAKWDGSSWSALGSGVDAGVSALVVSGTAVYAGGSFTTAGGIPANYIAKWDGSNWSALGSGIDACFECRVDALAVSGTAVYAGGHFITVGGIPANSIARWDGSSWSALGSGVNYTISALAVSESDLYVGGNFTIAGGKASAYLAKAIINPGNWLTLRFGVPGPHTNTLTYVGVPNMPYLLQFATNLTTSPWFPLATNTPPASGRGTVQDPNATGPRRFYRVSDP